MQRCIAVSDAPNGVTVSTVFLGVDHQFGLGPPLLFETMIFGGSHDQEMWRYTSRMEAQRGHEAVVAALRDGVSPRGKGRLR